MFSPDKMGLDPGTPNNQLKSGCLVKQPFAGKKTYHPFETTICKWMAISRCKAVYLFPIFPFSHLIRWKRWSWSLQEEKCCLGHWSQGSFTGVWFSEGQGWSVRGDVSLYHPPPKKRCLWEVYVKCLFVFQFFQVFGMKYRCIIRCNLCCRIFPTWNIVKSRRYKKLCWSNLWRLARWTWWKWGQQRVKWHFSGVKMILWFFGVNGNDGNDARAQGSLKRPLKMFQFLYIILCTHNKMFGSWQPEWRAQ